MRRDSTLFDALSPPRCVVIPLYREACNALFWAPLPSSTKPLLFAVKSPLSMLSSRSVLVKAVQVL